MNTCKYSLSFSLFCITALLFSTLTFAQVQPENAKVTASRSDLEPLSGDWTGTLKYLDYSDDSTLVVLNARMSAKQDGEVVKMTMTVVEPNGEEHPTESEWSVSRDGRKVNWNGKSWFVSDKKTTDNGTTIVFQGPGMDDDKSAQIMNVLYIGHQDSCILRKQVLYDGGGREFVRSEYRFGRVKEDSAAEGKSGE